MSKYIHVKIEEVIRTKVEEITEGLYMVMFSDGVEKEHTTTELRLVILIYRGFIKCIQFDIDSSLYIRNFYKSGVFCGKTQDDMMSAMIAKITKITKSQSVFNNIKKEIAFSYEEVYNKVAYKCLTAMHSIDVMDTLEMYKVKEVADALDEVKKKNTPKSILDAYDVIDDALRHKLSKGNKLAGAYKAGTVKSNQSKQMYLRGFVSDINGSIYTTPITSGFAGGLETAYDYIVESRSAVKAAAQSGGSLQQSEYFGRLMQSSSMGLYSIHDTDCDTSDLVEWLVSDKEYAEDGSLIYGGDIPGLLGKHYKLNKNDVGYLIVTKDSDIVNKTIYLRQVNSCTHPDSYGVCRSCLGEINVSIPRHYNLGYILSARFSSKMGQLLLSAKHVIESATTGDLYIDDSAASILDIKRDGLAFSKELSKYDRVTFKVKSKFCKGLSLISEPLTKRANVYSITNIPSIIVSVYKDDKVSNIPITIKQLNRYGSLSNGMVNRTLTHKFKLLETDEYEFDVTKYLGKTVFVFPNLEYSYFDLMKEVKTLLTVRTLRKNGVSSETPADLVEGLFRLINRKLTINIALIEVIVYSFTAYCARSKDMRMSRGSKTKSLINLKELIKYRSAGGSIGAGWLMSFITKPSTADTRKPRHPMDILFIRKGVIEAHRARVKRWFTG